MVLRLSTLILALGGALLVGCGGSDEPANGGDGCGDDYGYGGGCGCGCGHAEDDEDGAENVFEPAMATATIKGVVNWEGKAPRRVKIKMEGDKFCDRAHSGDVFSETWSINDGKVQNVFVQVTSGYKRYTYAKPRDKKVLDQQGCMYAPHVSGLMVGQELAIRNSDPTMHNIHAVSMATKRDVFNFAQTEKGMENVRTFRRPGRYAVTCDVHGWMSSYVVVTRHPFYDVSAEDGSFELKLPPGEYEIQAWHESAGEKTQTVKVGDGETKEVSFTFSR